MTKIQPFNSTFEEVFGISTNQKECLTNGNSDFDEFFFSLVNFDEEVNFDCEKYGCNFLDIYDSPKMVTDKFYMSLDNDDENFKFIKNSLIPNSSIPKLRRFKSEQNNKTTPKTQKLFILKRESHKKNKEIKEKNKEIKEKNEEKKEKNEKKEKKEKNEKEKESIKNFNEQLISYRNNLSTYPEKELDNNKNNNNCHHLNNNTTNINNDNNKNSDYYNFPERNRTKITPNVKKKNSKPKFTKIGSLKRIPLVLSLDRTVYEPKAIHHFGNRYNIRLESFSNKRKETEITNEEQQFKLKQKDVLNLSTFYQTKIEKRKTKKSTIIDKKRKGREKKTETRQKENREHLFKVNNSKIDFNKIDKQLKTDKININKINIRKINKDNSFHYHTSTNKSKYSNGGETFKESRKRKSLYISKNQSKIIKKYRLNIGTNQKPKKTHFFEITIVNRNLTTENSQKIFEEWFLQHNSKKRGPYPDHNTQQQLAQMTGSSVLKVIRWFGQRRRIEKELWLSGKKTKPKWLNKNGKSKKNKKKN
ncbi:homeobox protein meis3-related [Anaeramoeba flamelloides]|uniref:Homeobox protein meis3-related n=1 Tax=Anaeramoeba flamelloides TaxID=1746091 RepID=A0AAV7YB69_9EUKA|nr:homeobox protein meis3-related [Anaeramoeba flamelloides]